MEVGKRDGFGSKLGAIMATAGSAVGLGNIFRFPCMAGENGGGAFLMVYLLILLLIGVPMMLTEMIIGRRTGKSVVGALRELSPKKSKWAWCGYVSVMGAVLLLTFYTTISGWTLEYIYKSIANEFANKDVGQIENMFINFHNSKFAPFFWQIVVVLITAVVLSKGIKDGIEKFSMLFMPIMFVVIIVLCVRSLLMPNSIEGVKFFLLPDFSKITEGVILNALGQVFFSLSIGMGCLVTYGSYINKKDNLSKSATYVCIIDTVVALFIGVTIFSAAFSVGINPEMGFGLAFNTLPVIFNQMIGGYFFCILFFISLAIAAITSIISMFEVVVEFFLEEINFSRNKSILITSLLVLFIGFFVTCSLRADSVFIIGGRTLFDLLDAFTSNVLMPVGGLLLAVFVGWSMKKEYFYDELTCGNTIKIGVKEFLYYVIKFVIPIVIIVIFINQWI